MNIRNYTNHKLLSIGLKPKKKLKKKLFFHGKYLFLPNMGDELKLIINFFYKNGVDATDSNHSRFSRVCNIVSLMHFTRSAFWISTKFTNSKCTKLTKMYSSNYIH